MGIGALVASKIRLDEKVLALGLAPSIERSRALIMTGNVLVDDTPISKAGTKISVQAIVRLKVGVEEGWASRGAKKLIPALDSFDIDPSNRVCLDIGASTGGFTDVLLRRGAKRIYAVDVGYGQLVWRLQNDSRVVVLDRTNARHLTQDQVPEPIDLCVIDVSFISLKSIFPAVFERLDPGAELLAMVKPQFEVPKHLLGEGGVVHDEHIRLEVIGNVVDGAVNCGFSALGQRDNDVLGPKGNRECFVHLRRPN